MSVEFPFAEFNACGQSVIKVELGNVVVTQETQKSLANQLMNSARSAGEGFTTTVWISVVSKKLPEYLIPSIASFAGFGIGLVVTHGDKCSHLPGPQLSESVIGAIRTVTRAGQIWHPLEDKLVFAEP